MVLFCTWVSCKLHVFSRGPSNLAAPDPGLVPCLARDHHWPADVIMTSLMTSSPESDLLTRDLTY